jgi:hypothetical protein
MLREMFLNSVAGYPSHVEAEVKSRIALQLNYELVRLFGNVINDVEILLLGDSVYNLNIGEGYVVEMNWKPDSSVDRFSIIDMNGNGIKFFDIREKSDLNNYSSKTLAVVGSVVCNLNAKLNPKLRL